MYNLKSKRFEKVGSYLKSKRFDKVGFCSPCAHSPGWLLNKHPLGNHIPG